MGFNLVLKPVLKGELRGRSRCSRIRMSIELPKVAVWRAFREMDDGVSGRIPTHTDKNPSLCSSHDTTNS